MGNTLSDFGALKGLKKELEKQEQGASSDSGSVQQRKSKTVQHRTREEEHARNIGIEKGARVRMMDTNDTGTIVGIRKDCYEVEVGGLVIPMVRSEFILIDEDEDKRMLASMPSRPKKHLEQKSSSLNSSSEMVVDLHFEKIPGYENVPEWAALDYQMNWFRKILCENLKHRGKRIVFIHGDGDGTLKAAVRKELDEAFAISCTYTFSDSDQYGTGATAVTIK